MSKLKTDRTSRSPWAEKDSKCFHWNINSDWSRSSHYSGHPYLRAGQEVKILVIILGVMGKTQPILWAQRDWPRKTQPFSSGEWGRRNWPEIRRPALPWHSYPGAINFPSVCQFRTGTISPRKKDTTMQGSTAWSGAWWVSAYLKVQIRPALEMDSPLRHAKSIVWASERLFFLCA